MKARFNDKWIMKLAQKLKNEETQLSPLRSNHVHSRLIINDKQTKEEKRRPLVKNEKGE